MTFTLNRESGEPLYRQLARELAQAAAQGAFESTGGRLPTADELCAAARVGRDTVKAAWALLEEQGVVTRTRGSGVYVCGARRAETTAHTGAGSAEDAARTVDELLLRLGELGVEHKQAYALLMRELSRAFSGAARVRTALVDCTPETLNAVRRQLECIEQLELTTFLIDDLFLKKTFIGPEYDLILTPHHHYDDLARFLAPAHLRVEQIALRESRRLVAALAALPEDGVICILYRSAAFLSSVRYAFAELGRKNKQQPLREDELDEAAQAMVRGGCALVVPPDYLEGCSVRALQLIERANKFGCAVIPFEFEVDSGSLLYLARRVRELQAGGARDGALL